MSVLYLFRRDFRLHDNLALNELTFYLHKVSSRRVYFTFIFTPEQTDPTKNKYFTQSGFDFMLSALRELSTQIHVNFLYGDYIEQITKILDHDSKIKHIYFNHDYSDYARMRDMKIFKLGKSRNISVNAYHDSMLKGKLLEKGYKVMNAYVRRIKNIKLLPKINTHMLEKSAKKLSIASSLKTIISKYFSYVSMHDINPDPSSLVLNAIRSGKYKKHGSRIGPYVKFGLISCRELYLLNTFPAYKREVIIREFFYQCQAFFRDELLEFHSKNWVSPYFKSEFKLLESDLKKDLKSKTHKQIIKSFYTKSGTYKKLPTLIQKFITKLIDNNYLQNRERMMLATYLIHNLGFDWRLCEKFYAQNLQDYDPVINGLNWMWVAKIFFHTRPQIMKLKNFHY